MQIDSDEIEKILQHFANNDSIYEGVLEEEKNIIKSGIKRAIKSYNKNQPKLETPIETTTVEEKNNEFELGGKPTQLELNLNEPTTPVTPTTTTTAKSIPEERKIIETVEPSDKSNQGYYIDDDNEDEYRLGVRNKDEYMLDVKTLNNEDKYEYLRELGDSPEYRNSEKVVEVIPTPPTRPRVVAEEPTGVLETAPIVETPKKDVIVLEKLRDENMFNIDTNFLRARDPNSIPTAQSNNTIRRSNDEPVYEDSDFGNLRNSLWKMLGGGREPKPNPTNMFNIDTNFLRDRDLDPIPTAQSKNNRNKPSIMEQLSSMIGRFNTPGTKSNNQEPIKNPLSNSPNLDRNKKIRDRNREIRGKIYANDSERNRKIREKINQNGNDWERKNFERLNPNSISRVIDTTNPNYIRPNEKMYIRNKGREYLDERYGLFSKKHKLIKF
jgi:hypothetical protein